MLISVQKVRQNAPFAPSGTYTTGDGKGAQNPVRCDGANWLYVFVYVDKPASATDYTIQVDWHGNADDPYSDTLQSISGGTATATRSSFTFPATEIVGGAVDMRYYVAMPVAGRWARISAKSTYGGSAPVCAICAATGNTVGGEGASSGVFLIKKPGSLANAATVTGDGVGTENPIPIRRADRVVLLIDANLVVTSQLVVWPELSVDGYEYYRETYWTGSGAVTANLKKYQFTETEFGGAGQDGRVALAVDVIGARARFSFNAKAGSATNLACRAIVGRV